MSKTKKFTSGHTKRPPAARYTDVPIEELEAKKKEDEQPEEAPTAQEPNGMVSVHAPTSQSQSEKNEIDTEPTVDELVFRAASVFTKIVNNHATEKTRQQKLKELLHGAEEFEKEAIDETLSKGIGVLDTRPKSKTNKPRGDTAGSGWFDLPAPRLTPDLKRELHVLSLRSHVDRARKYKKGSEIQSGKWPKYFQIASVESGPADRYSANRTTKKDRSKSIAQALLADARQRKYRKEKFLEIQRSRSSKKQQHKAGGSRKPKKERRSKKNADGGD